MKRKINPIGSINFIEPEKDQINYLRYKKERLTVRHAPPLYIENAMTLDHWVVTLLFSEIYKENIMEVYNLKYFTFLLFLGAQGKEYIPEIRETCLQGTETLIFVSLNINTKSIKGRSISYIDNEICKSLASYFDILDPLGGGVYPLDYLVVADKNLKVRCKVPIQICKSRQVHQKFCIDLSQLKGFLEEYLIFASHDLIVN